MSPNRTEVGTRLPKLCERTRSEEMMSLATASKSRKVAPALNLKETALKIQAATASPQKAMTQNRSVLVPAVPETFAYDADVNLLQDGLRTYEWDADVARQRGDGAPKARPEGCRVRVPLGRTRQQNRLTAQELRADVSTTTWKRLEYSYDREGRRIRKLAKTKTSPSGTWTTASDTRFLYDGWNLIAEYSYVSSTFTLLRSHAWGLDLSGSQQQSAGGVGGLLWTTVAATAKTYAAAADTNGNVIAYVDCADGTIAGKRDYGAFGEALVTTGVAGSLPFGFSAKYEEKETGLLYYGYRYYSPSTGRWPSKDPIGEAGGINLYGMIENDAINHRDVLGLAAEVRIQRDTASPNHFTAEGGDASGNIIKTFGVTKNYVGSSLMPPSSNYQSLTGAGIASYAISAELTESISVSWPSGEHPEVLTLQPSGEIRLKISVRNASCGVVKIAWGSTGVTLSSPTRKSIFTGSSMGTLLNKFFQGVNGSGVIYNLPDHTSSGPFGFKISSPSSSWVDIGTVQLGHNIDIISRPDTASASATLKVKVSAL
jgi:RHS repeat-associated protein